MNYRDTLCVENGKLRIGGFSAEELVNRFGTPIYVLDESYIRRMCRVYKNSLAAYSGDTKVLYASKALSCTALYSIVKSEGLGVDVVSGGELFTALSAGVDPATIYFHGNNKTEKELHEAVDAAVGCIVCDSFDEMRILDGFAKQAGIVQKCAIRVNTGVEAHTHHFIQTSKVDSKFGFSVSNGDAFEAAERISSFANLKLSCIHSHIGSQIFETEPFGLAVDVLCDFITSLAKINVDIDELNLGGGYGIYYAEGDKALSSDGYKLYVDNLINAVNKCVKKNRMKKPTLIIEPGRSIVGEAGVTLYTVGAIKEIRGVKKYIAIDGGMFENPRYALYQAKYSACIANRADEASTELVTIAGKCCESGDVIIDGIELPRAERGDIIAVFSTGAYNYSMASNYNRNLIPPIVLVSGDKADYIVKPQSYDDLVRNDVVPSWIK